MKKREGVGLFFVHKKLDLHFTTIFSVDFYSTWFKAVTAIQLYNAILSCLVAIWSMVINISDTTSTTSQKYKSYKKYEKKVYLILSLLHFFQI
jgi:hypothetical protein